MLTRVQAEHSDSVHTAAKVALRALLDGPNGAGRDIVDALNDARLVLRVVEAEYKRLSRVGSEVIFVKAP